ncbi:MOSC domain-containing protein [Nitrospira sp. KM1]|uniref:MOSC domain-containing protein n=1 Tax=Nitrospira sp. KM1 TaxID=1936990 RepID=UPI0018D8C3C3|nr:MOSC domain-containing protein [Nitrospira sp. KM1]
MQTQTLSQDRVMKIISVQVGRPRTVRWHGKTASTGIYKMPVSGRIMARRFNLEGDEQADRTVHGGRDKAIYVYPSEHYAFWRQEFPDRPMTYGMFGENLTTEGLDERSVRIGDRFRIGHAVVEVTQPRVPCYKLGIRFDRPDMPKRFHASRRCGFYLAVLQEGTVGAGDVWELISRDEAGVSVAEGYRRYFQDGP